jgi:hypothetical protein
MRTTTWYSSPGIKGDEHRLPTDGGLTRELGVTTVRLGGNFVSG